MKKKILAVSACIFVALLWAGGFVAAQQAMDNGWGTFSILFQRNAIGFLITFFFGIKYKFWKNKKMLFTGLIAGVIYFAGYAFQLIGQTHTTIANTGLISGGGVVLTPIVALLFRKKPTKSAVIASVIGLIGTLVLTYEPGLKFHIGDILVFLATICYSLQICFLSRFQEDQPIIPIVCLQFFIMTVCSGIALPIAKQPFIGEPIGWIGVLYYALAGGLIAMILQLKAQKVLEPSKVSLCFSFEGLFAAVLGYLFYKEQLTLQIFIGGLILIGAVIFSSFVKDIKPKKKKIEEN